MPIWFTLILLVATFVLSELLRPKPEIEDAKPSGIGDFNVPTATQGRIVPLVWGTCQIKGPNVVWYGDLKQVPIKEKVKTGMFSSKKIVTGYKYYLGLQFGLCRGPIDNLRKVWIKEKLVYNGATTGAILIDYPNLFGGDDLGYGGVVGTLRTHVGSMTQAANSYLSAFQKVSGVTPRYLGTSYLVWEGGYIGNSTSIDAWAFEIRRVPNGLGLATPGVNSGADANPMNVIYELMTDAEWGLAIPAADIDAAAFETAAATLLSEGNGYSRLLDRQIEAKDLLREIEEQIDAIVYLDLQTGKWTIKLIRDDYDIDLVPQLDESNVVDVQDFSRGAWNETTNQVKVAFNNRSNTYAEDFALAQDMANAIAQGGGTPTTGKSIMASPSYPGVKNGALATAIAWRDLRALSYPLAKATFVVDKSFWDTTPGQVLAWTDADLGISKMPMRVLRVDHGELADNRMQLRCVQDVFQFPAGLFGDPPDTNWTPPDDDLDAFPADEQLAFEAPRAVVWRDPERSGDPQDKIWCAGRQQDNAVGFYIRERHTTSPGTPSGDFAGVGEVYAFMLVGQLKNAIEIGGNPETSILLTASPDAQAILEAAFEDDPDIGDQGVNLLNLVLVGSEFMLPRSAQVSGADVQLDSVYRGVLDGGMEHHAAGADVYLVFVGGGLIDTTIPDNEVVDVKLVPFSQYDEVAEGDASTVQLTMDDRLIRPYPPANLDLNASNLPQGTVSLDYLASGAPETTGVELKIYRRNYLVADGGDEIANLLADASDLDASTDHSVSVYNDPDGTPALLFTESNFSGQTQNLLRIKILKETDGVIPSRLQVVVTSRHDAGGKTGLVSRNAMKFCFDAGSAALSGQFNFGALDTDDVSNEYTADAAGTHAFTLSSAFGAAPGDVEYRIDTGGGYGSWIQLIPQGSTTGNITGVVVSDKIQIRHKATAASQLKQIDMVAPGAGTDAYGILFT